MKKLWLLKQIWFPALVILALIVAALTGLICRQTYTDVTAEENYTDNVLVAEMPGALCENACALGREFYPTAPVILRVRAVGEIEDYYGVSQQKVQIREIFGGTGLSVGDEIYLTCEGRGWCVLAEGRERPLTLERFFVNFLQVGEDYLVFLKDDRVEAFEDVPVYFLLLHESRVCVSPVFCYTDRENVVVPTSGDTTYVPYYLVRDNEFFVDTEEGLAAWQELKAELLARYPAGDS